MCLVYAGKTPLDHSNLWIKQPDESLQEVLGVLSSHSSAQHNHRGVLEGPSEAILSRERGLEGYSTN